MFAETIKKSTKINELIKKGDSIVVGVSGGPDSVFLLYFLNSLREELKLKLTIGHLDHMLRKDSPKDAEFVKKLGDKLGIPVITGRINVKLLSKNGSIEEIARNARLGFLFKVARDAKARKIALAHNLDDQAETVLMRLIRGSGLSGLSAIQPKKEIAGFAIVRPLLNIRRREIEELLKKSGIRVKIDKSNFKDIYLRNKIRNKLIPLFEKEYNPKIKEVLAGLANNAAHDYDFLDKEALRISKNRLGKLKLSWLTKLHPSIRRMILRLNIKKLQGSTRRITFKHITEIEDLIDNRPVNSIVDLPKGFSVIKKKESLIFCHRQ